VSVASAVRPSSALEPTKAIARMRPNLFDRWMGYVSSHSIRGFDRTPHVIML
jgi:hypothetical protein